MPKRKEQATEDQSRKDNTLMVQLDEEQIEALQLLPDALKPSFKCLAPVFEAFRENYGRSLPHKRTLPTRQATDFKRTTAAARSLGIDYKEDDASYDFTLNTEHLQNSGQLSEHFARVINDLKTSDYASARHDESFCRTILDLIIMDRLRHLEDQDTHHRLQVSAEVPIAIRVKDLYGNDEIIKGRADWALGYGLDKSDTGAILLVVEAKPFESAPIGMPQLLVYMAAVHKARHGRVNQSVFGMLSDSKEFRFAFLSEEKKLFTSVPFVWHSHQSIVLAYIDMMLINAIESSPHTTPQKTRNRIIHRYPEYLGRQWKFGDNSDDGEDEKEEEEEEEGEEDAGEEQNEDKDDNDVVDVVNIGGRVVMRLSSRDWKKAD